MRPRRAATKSSSKLTIAAGEAQEMKLQLIGMIVGLVFGVLWTALVAAYLFYTRSSRMAHNQYVIRLGQLLVGGLAIGSLFLLLRLCEQIGLVIHTSPYDTSLYAFVLSSGCVMFFAVRAEIRWRKSSGLDQTTTLADNTKRPMVPPLKRKLLSLLMLGVASTSLGFSAGFLMRGQRPESLYLGAASWLGLFAILVLLTTFKDRAHALRLQRFMLVAFTCVEIAMLGLFWKFRASSPAFSSAALAAAIMLCIGATVALFVMRRIMPRT